MSKSDVTKIWSLNYRLVASVIAGVAPALGEMGLEVKELFLLAEVEAHPHPAELAETLCIPKPTVTLYLKRVVAAGFVKREIDSTDLRRHKLTLTPEGGKVMTRGLSLLAQAFGERLEKLTAAEQAEYRAHLEKMSGA